MTHKLNNLLAVIQGFSSLVLMQEDLDEMSKENVQQMKEAAGTASELGERILPAAGCSRVDLAEVVLEDSVPLLATRLRARVEGANLPFHLHVSENLPPIVADSDRLRVILDELVNNAVEAAGSRGEVTLEIAHGQAYDGLANRVTFQVRNTESEIPEDKLREVFKPFYTTKDTSHMGIGLTTASVLAGHMGMDLGVKSEGRVTTFQVTAKTA